MSEINQGGQAQAKKSASRQMFFVLLLILILLITGFSFVISPAFSVGNIVVSGNKYLTVEEVYQIAGIPEKINIFRLNAGEIQERLYKDLRVEKARIARSFPSTISIHITERKPVAYVACDYGFVEVDKDGMVLAAYKTMKRISVPMITGVTLRNLYVGDQVDDALLMQILTYLSDMEETAINQLSEVNIEDKNQIVAYTTDSAQIRIGNTERLAEKAKISQEFIGELKIAKLPIEFIDLNFATPYIKFKNQ